jgi:cell division protein FtsB
VILVAFVIEVTLHGMEEELGSLVVVLRLWRVFQIIEELRSASEDTMEIYEDEMESLRQENASLKQRLNLNIGDEGTA